MSAMIKLTHFGGNPFVVNAELIRYVEARPDTHVTMTDGDRFVVRETMDQVVSLVIDYQRSKYLVPAAPQRGNS
jgi:flagellar protein FlbD